jgi:hypothetical protein
MGGNLIKHGKALAWTNNFNINIERTIHKKMHIPIRLLCYRKEYLWWIDEAKLTEKKGFSI